MDNVILEKAQKIIAESKEYHPRAVVILDTGEKRVLRIFKSSANNFCYFAPHSRNSGYPLNNLKLTDILPLQKKKSEEEIWRTSWIKVKNKLEISGLWQEVLDDLKFALDIGYEKINQADKVYWERHDKLSYDKSNEANAQKIKEIDERLVGINEQGKLYAITSIIWYFDKSARVKKMYFGQYNDYALKKIALAMQKKEKCSESGQASYDVSFEYAPDKNKAWYSEEFRGCGNGHYYLALDSTHALFYEDN